MRAGERKGERVKRRRRERREDIIKLAAKLVLERAAVAAAGVAEAF